MLFMVIIHPAACEHRYLGSSRYVVGPGFMEELVAGYPRTIGGRPTVFRLVCPD